MVSSESALWKTNLLCYITWKNIQKPSTAMEKKNGVRLQDVSEGRLKKII